MAALVQSINADQAKVAAVAQFADAAKRAKLDALGRPPAGSDTGDSTSSLASVDTEMYRAATDELVASRAKDAARSDFDYTRQRLSAMATALYVHADVATPQDPTDGGAINRAGLLAILLHTEQDQFASAKHRLDDANDRFAAAKSIADGLVAARAAALQAIAAAISPATPTPDASTAQGAGTAPRPTGPVLIAAKGAGPTILGPVVLTGDELAGWFAATGRKARLTVPLPELAGDYANTGTQDNIRGDIAFAQSVLETGYFAFPDGGQLTQADNNFAGIGACDSCNHGWQFPDAKTGVAAQLQLLHQYASKGPVPGPLPGLVSVAACCPTWMGLSGVWATGPDYGYHILAIYQKMLEWALSRRSSAAGL
jgi:hypothetical protein